MFFDWNEDEWCSFDNYMIENLMFYLKNGLIKSDFKNLSVRKLSAATSHEFIEFCGLILGSRPNELLRVNEKIYMKNL